MRTAHNDTLLGTQPIGKLLMRMSVPSGVAMLVGAAYNLVDAVFVGRGVGADGIAALALAFPVQMLFMAIAGLLGFGAASVISRNLGSGNHERARQATGTALGLSVLVGITATVVGLAAFTPLLRLLGASEALVPVTGDYLSVILMGVVVTTVTTAANNLIRSEGQAQFAMLSMATGMVLNIALDPVFIFALKMGMRGAALATVISQMATLVLVVYFFAGGRSALGVRAGHLVPTPGVIGEIISLGLPTLVRQSGMSLLMVIINNSLGAYGSDLHIAAYGAVMRLLIFMIMPVFGIAQGFQPIAGYNYGALRFDRVLAVIRVSIFVTISLNSATFAVMMIFPRPLLSVFSPDPELLDIGVSMLRIFILIVPLIGVQFVGAGLFQAIGKALPALILSLSRQFLLLIPLALTLPHFFGVMGVIVAFPAADLLSTVITSLLMTGELRRMKQRQRELPEDDGSQTTPLKPAVDGGIKVGAEAAN